MAEPAEPSQPDVSYSSEPSRICNADEAVRALEQGKHYLNAREYERAMRLFRRSYRLQPIPETALLMQRLRDEISRDTNYCKDCYRYQANCQCGPSSATSANGAGQQAAGSPPNIATAFDVQQLQRMWNQYTRTVHQGLRCLGAANEYISALTMLFTAIIVALLLRMIVGGPLIDILATGTPVHHAYHFSPFVSSVALTILVNVLLRWSSRGR